jgi:hypothetical protein
VSSDAAIESQLVRRGNPKAKSQGYAVFGRQTLQSKTGFCAENRFAFNRLDVVHGRLNKSDYECRRDALAVGGTAYIGFGITERTGDVGMYRAVWSPPGSQCGCSADLKIL